MRPAEESHLVADRPAVRKHLRSSNPPPQSGQIHRGNQTTGLRTLRNWTIWGGMIPAGGLVWKDWLDGFLVRRNTPDLGGFCAEWQGGPYDG